jgi:hypothetical protein
MVTGLHPWCPLPPHPNPPPRRGEGRVGVMFLMSFLQCLGRYMQFLENSSFGTMSAHATVGEKVALRLSDSYF